MSALLGLLGRGLGLLMVAAVQLYRYTLSPMLGPRCRFAPSCSEYTIEAIRLHGPIVGLGYGLRRIVRCHPFGGSGYDPVPAPRRSRDASGRARAGQAGMAAASQPAHEQKV